MKQTTEDDALVGLLSAVILQAVDDYHALQKRGRMTADGVVVGHRFGRLGRSKSYGHCDGMRNESEGRDLVRFFKGWQLDFLCDAVGFQACRIRRKLGLSKEVL